MNAKTGMPVQKIYSEPVSQENRLRPSDSSFDDHLKQEELRLSEKQRHFMSLPWKEFQGIFNSVPLQFDFKFSAGAAEYNLAKPDQGPDLYKAENEDSAALRLDHEAGGKTAEDTSSSQRISYTLDKNAFVQNLAAASKYAISEMWIPFNSQSIQGIEGKSVDLELIVSEIVDKIKIVKEGEKVTLSLALKPDEASDLLFNLTMKNGIVSISIIADQKAREWLEANIAALEESLTKANIQLGNLEVSSKKREAGESFESIPPVLSKEKETENIWSVDMYVYENIFGLAPERAILSEA